jgi:uncharacterized C2H2 Zn-finger protein
MTGHVCFYCSIELIRSRDGKTAQCPHCTTVYRKDGSGKWRET